MSFKIMPYGGQQWAGHYADNQDIKQYLGLRPSDKLPPSLCVNFTLPLTDGREVKALCLTGHRSREGMRGKSSAHRVYVRCPDCDKPVPAGRTHQHKC